MVILWCGFLPPVSSSVISTAAAPLSSFFRWVTMRAVSVWHSCIWAMHHTTGTLLGGCRSLVLEKYCTLQCCQVNLSIGLQDTTAAAGTHASTHFVLHVNLVLDDGWHQELLSTHQRQSCQAWIAVQMGRSELNPWFPAPGPPEWHGGQICYLWLKKEQGIEG